MSITTRKGDEGYTNLCYGQRVSKSHPVVHTVGAVDSLTVSIGVARVIFCEKGYAPITAFRRTCSAFLREVQERLQILMGEVSTLPEDWAKYEQQFGTITEDDLAALDRAVETLDPFIDKEQRTWSIPGDHAHTACLERARVDCREAERWVFDLTEFWQEVGHDTSRFATTFKYLNRLSDILWMMARVMEQDVTSEINAIKLG